ncbi:hypothetical protein JAAARDRAFT_168018 [Jaapia argillacea MUCL 33604]|uniref:Partial AB-hydrolase lipase domain-containing protein n=1 Tax=Jaapia argillacea MUCL 33604 TaxID=933084 RepID=A0A067QDI3_9AGAM|nr:hypothetical protein JAAARDRAFT_168018 [Jaapia argillacea MUCL 33604]
MSTPLKRPNPVSYGTIDDLQSLIQPNADTAPRDTPVTIQLYPDANSPISHPRRLHRYALPLLSTIVSTMFLLLVVAWATIASFPVLVLKWWNHKEESYTWDHERHKGEEIVKDVQYYARQVGFEIVDEQAETDDGYFLRIHRVVNPRRPISDEDRGGYPVLILHGLFQSSGAFITSEERSLAFWLSENGGYQVFLGNTRGVFQMGHKQFDYDDPQFWDWTIQDLAMYDLPALVEWVCNATGYDKIAFIGHSQGNGLAFLTLSQDLRPDIGDKLSCFIALAPAVYAGPLTNGFPFNLLGRVDWNSWQQIFGIHDFIPVMRYSYDWVPARPFAAVGYIMFAYLFAWTDANWLKRRKVKVFRFTPTPVSSASIFWWCGKGGFAQRKCTLEERVPRWFDQRFPPLLIYYGGRDFLVDTENLLERLRKHEEHVRLLKVVKLDEAEHCDFYLAASAVEWCFHSILEDIERTRIDSTDNSYMDMA